LPISADLHLFDTSAAMAFVDPDNPYHRQVRDLTLAKQRGLAGHAVFEFLSVLTRLPLPKRLHSSDAIRLMRSEFSHNHFLPVDVMDPLVGEFAQLGIVGGMVYDGLVGACARHHQLVLMTCDQRAEETYRLLGVEYHLVQGAEA
jgi:predicted nucleic acid-binding protein